MADINLNFGTDDLNELRKLLNEFAKIADKIRGDLSKGGIISQDDELRMKILAAESLKVANELEKQQRVKAKMEGQDTRATQKVKEQSGIIGGLERQVKEYTAAWKSANTQMEKQQAKKNLDDVKKKLTEAKGITNEWGKALGSFQFKFNALGNIAANVLQGMVRNLTNVTKEFITFDKIINSTQISGDKFAETVGALKSGFAALNQSIASGDWTNFFQRFKDAAEAGRDFIKALDEIEDQNNSVILSNQDLQAEVENLKLEIIKADKYTISERTKMADEAIAKEKKILENEKEIIQDRINAYTESFGALNKLTAQEQESFLRDYKTNQEAYGDLLRERERLEKAVASQIETTYQTTYGGIQVPVQKLKEGHEAATKALADFDNQAKQNEGFTAWMDMLQRSNLFSQEQRNKLTALFKELGVAEAASASGMKRLESQYQSLLRQADKTIETVKEISDIFKEEPLDFEDFMLTPFEKMTKTVVEMDDKMKSDLEQRAQDNANELLRITKERADKEELINAGNTRLQIEGMNAIHDIGQALGKKSAKMGQTVAIGEAIINQALAVTDVWKKWASQPQIAIPLTALAIAQTAAQIATIKAQKFAEGGEVGGRPHSHGGTMIEAERGEFVVRKDAYRKNKELIQAINSDDNLRIAEMMSRDRKLIITKQEDYTKKLYDLLSSQAVGYETPEFYVIQKGNKQIKLHKN